MTPDWTQGAHLAPERNEMHSPDVAEFVRRYPGAGELYHALDCAQEVVETWQALNRAARISGTMIESLLNLEAALEAMTREPKA